MHELQGKKNANLLVPRDRDAADSQTVRPICYNKSKLFTQKLHTLSNLNTAKHLKNLKSQKSVSHKPKPFVSDKGTKQNTINTRSPIPIKNKVDAKS